jgi:hypothetical protein
MPVAPRDEDLAELARRTAVQPVPLWIYALVVVAFVDTVLIALGLAMLAHDILLFGGRRESELTPLFGGPFVVALLMLVPIVRGGRASRWLRLLVVIVVSHAVLLPVLAILLRDPSLPDLVPRGWSAPAGAIAALAIFAFAGAWTALRGGVPRAMHALVAFFLTLSLVYGLALPFAACIAGAPEKMHVAAIIALSVVPAVAVAAWVARAERPLPRAATRTVVAVAVLCGACAVVAMPAMRTDGFFAFVQGLDVLLGCGFVTVASIVALALMSWWGLRRASQAPPLDPPRVVAGTVAAKDAVVGWFRYLGVLRGARTELAGFDLQTDSAVLPVAAGATLVATLPDDALDPVAGERIPALRVGDKVVVIGFAAPAEGDFRTNAAPMPGPRGLRVLRVEDESWEKTTPMHEVVLGVWRPCLAYVAAMTLVTTPVAWSVLVGAITF